MKKGQKRPKYISCKENNLGKHKFERIKHNVFDKCILCGKPRFTLVDLSFLIEKGGSLERALDANIY